MSLDNNLSFEVDVANDGTTVTQTYEDAGSVPGKATYVAPTHLPDSRNKLEFTANNPQSSGNFRGTGKSTMKITKDKAVNGVDATTSLTVPLIGEVKFSIPLGVPSEDAKHLRQEMIAMLDDDTLWEKVSMKLIV